MKDLITLAKQTLLWANDSITIEDGWDWEAIVTFLNSYPNADKAYFSIKERPMVSTVQLEHWQDYYFMELAENFVDQQQISVSKSIINNPRFAESLFFMRSLHKVMVTHGRKRLKTQLVGIAANEFEVDENTLEKVITFRKRKELKQLFKTWDAKIEEQQTLKKIPVATFQASNGNNEHFPEENQLINQVKTYSKEVFDFSYDLELNEQLHQAIKGYRHCKSILTQHKIYDTMLQDCEQGIERCGMKMLTRKGRSSRTILSSHTPKKKNYFLRYLFIALIIGVLAVAISRFLPEILSFLKNL